MREWHHESTYLYEIVMNPRILDLVEGILGPDFLCLGQPFLHQASAQHWAPCRGTRMRIIGRSPFNTVTVWIAFDDVDEENGGMKLIPGFTSGAVSSSTGNKDDANSIISARAGGEGWYVST